MFLCVTGAIAVLFFLAKKRQWKISEGLRRSARRMTNAVKAVATPLTPKKMTFAFSPVEKRRVVGVDEENKLKRPRRGRAGERTTGAVTDLEKDGSVPAAVTVVAGGEVDGLADGDGVEDVAKKDKRRPPRVDIPPSVFDMDSPKTPMWKKVFGR